MRKTSDLRGTHLEKRSAIVLFLPRTLTMDISLAVTLRDCDAHCERLKGTTDAMFTAATDPGSGCKSKTDKAMVPVEMLKCSRLRYKSCRLS